ncbi:NADP-dependent oxidoreductase [Actinoplanes sp. TRM 88003]|uniref:NADP-dependent oxidoreductase n=1 Tax=Paractinoplanes aksuensis TaxID=2939490 RepID=A0ABT1DWG4_9ACTN|nr:NADP-dependent oxidoreductase [Actinoplanes aksuensis]MCO8274401.1 NADP-dependent oxidoreductase [Actinoplanes aksuensis]
MNMRLVRPTAYGSPDVLDVAEVPVPEPGSGLGPGEVLVRVKAAGVNPIDWKIYSGAFHDVDDDHHDQAGVDIDALPRIGLECAGVVDGNEVIVYPVTAAYADYVVAPADSLIAKPATLSWAEAAGLMLTGTTAAHALHAAGVHEGDTVLIHNGSGGVGLMAIQLATHRGAKVIATASEHNFELLRSLGATPVAYGPGLLDRVQATAPDGITAALDLIGTDEALDTSLALVADRTRIASITGGPRRAKEGIKLLGYGPGEDAGAELRAAARTDLATMAGAGNLRVLIAATYPLTQAAEAHRAGQSGHTPGKLILIP